MKLSHLIYKALSGRILLVALAILFTLCLGAAQSASEPGTVTIVINAEPAKQDPSDSDTSDTGRVILKNVVEPLLEVNPDDSSLSPRLATSWEQVDQNTWHFSLRKGVKFHDGADFNAEAMIFNIKRLYDKRINGHIYLKFFRNVKMEGKALDSHTLEIKTDTFEPLLPTKMGILTICSPNTPMDKMTRHPVGTGPYKFVKWDAGTQIVLERFDGYWGAKPQVKKAIYVWRSESAVRASMVLLGEADLAPTIAAQDANRPDMDFSYFNSETTALRIGGSWYPPLNDRRVRMALNLAVDRNAIRGSILSKDVVPATHVIVPSIFGYNPDLKVWPYDPQKAKQLIAEARKDGVPVDTEITIVGRYGIHSLSDEVCEALMSMFRAVGFNVKLKLLEKGAHDKYRRNPFVMDQGPYFPYHMHDNNYGDAGFSAFHHYHSKGTNSPVRDNTVDDLIERAQVATGEGRRSLWQAMFKRVNEEIIPDVLLFHMVGYTRVGKRINFKPSIATNSEVQLAQITFKQ